MTLSQKIGARQARFVERFSVACSDIPGADPKSPIRASIASFRHSMHAAPPPKRPGKLRRPNPTALSSIPSSPSSSTRSKRSRYSGVHRDTSQRLLRKRSDATSTDLQKRRERREIAIRRRGRIGKPSKMRSLFRNLFHPRRSARDRKMRKIVLRKLDDKKRQSEIEAFLDTGRGDRMVKRWSRGIREG